MALMSTGSWQCSLIQSSKFLLGLNIYKFGILRICKLWYSGRYCDFAKQLNASGYKVYGMDWIGKFGAILDAFPDLHLVDGSLVIAEVLLCFILKTWTLNQVCYLETLLSLVTENI